MKHNFLSFIVIVGALLVSAISSAAHPAWGIVVDRQGQIYFSDLETVWRIDTEGNVSVFRAGSSGRHVHDLTIDAEDNIYGVDNSYNQQTQTFPRALWKMSPKGEFSYLVPMTDNLPPGQSIWRDGNGNTYSIEPYNNERKQCKIIKRAPDGKTNLFAGGSYGYLDGQKEKAEFSQITDMAFGADDTIYLTDEAKVRKIDKSGMVTTVYPQGDSVKNQNPFSRLFGLTVDGQNNIFVADSGNRRVIKIASVGESATVLSAEQPWIINGVALRGNDVYVLESWFDEKESKIGTRVRKLSADGKITLLASVGDKPKQAASDKSTVENFQVSPDNQKNFPYILFGAGIALVTAVPVFWYCYRKLSA